MHSLTITARWSAVSPETIEHRSRSTRKHPFTSSVNSRSALFFLLRRMIACIGESPSPLGAFRSASLLLMCFNRVCGCVCVLVYRPELKTHTLAHHTHTHAKCIHEPNFTLHYITIAFTRSKFNDALQYHKYAYIPQSFLGSGGDFQTVALISF